MIAEIHNKISRSGSNLSERLEDQLTGDFFGTIRYLPFQKGLQHILGAARFLERPSNPAADWSTHLYSIVDYDYGMKFWFRHEEGEIDLLIDCSEFVIGIEVKYDSGLSSEDEDIEDVISPEESCNQLARYSRLLADIRNERPAYLLFLAPERTMLQVQEDISERTIISSNISLGFLSWQQVLERLQTIHSMPQDIGEQMILQDLTKLLIKKGFERFHGFLAGAASCAVSADSYKFNGKSQEQWDLKWPVNVKIEEDHYVYLP